MLEGKKAVAKVDGDRGQVSMVRNWWMGGILRGSRPRGGEPEEMTCWMCVYHWGLQWFWGEEKRGDSRMLEW